MKLLSFVNNNNIKEPDLLMESIHDRGLFKAVFLVGAPGVGKSTILKKVTSGLIEPRIVNVDKFTEFLNINDVISVYDKSKMLSKNQMLLYLDNILPIFIDTTGVNLTRLRGRINILEQLGYDYSAIIVNASLETSLQRNANRKRVVNPRVLEDYYKRFNLLKKDIKQLFNFNIEINNDDGELTDDIILKAFKRVFFFYDSPIQNPIGQERIELMKKNNWSTLSPNIMTTNSIKTLVNEWYG